MRLRLEENSMAHSTYVSSSKLFSLFAGTRGESHLRARDLFTEISIPAVLVLVLICSYIGAKIVGSVLSWICSMIESN
jgi:hypothetical protein